MAPDEGAIQNAVNDVLDGVSFRQAALRHGVNRQTVANRILGMESRQEAHASEQRLTPDQEQSLVHWILTQEALGYAPSHGLVKELAQRLLQAAGITKPLGKDWLKAFKKRNPAIRTKMGKRIEYKRINGASSEAINTWFDLYETLAWIKPDNTYNTDEAGIMEGMGLNGLVLRSSEVNPKSTSIKGNQGRSWTSLIETISATGRIIKPVIIFKAASIQTQWFAQEFKEDWHFTFSKNGWTSNEIALEWLEKVFIPETKPLDASEPRLLIVDGHGSHTTDDFMWNCFQENIFLLFLPAHSSHVLQPLDIGVFSALKTAYRRHLGLLNALTDSAPIGKLNFLRCLSKARKDALIAKNIKSGFRGTGIYPRNRYKPLKSTQVPARPATPPPPSNPLQSAAKDILHTPKSGNDILRLMRDHIGKSPTKRLLARKLAKAVDTKNTEVALKDRKILTLEEEVLRARPGKRRKVHLDPNTKFATIEDVIRRRDGEVAITVEESEGEESAGESAEEVIEVATRKSTRIRKPRHYFDE